MLRAPKSMFSSTGRRFAIVFLLVTSAVSIPRSARVMASSMGTPAGAEKPAPQVTVKPASATSPDFAFNDYDLESEQQLFDLANQARVQAGAPPLTLDAGLTHAARVHAEAMFAARQLSHRFPDEPSLPQRLAIATRAQLDREGENVALDFDAAQAHQHLILSPPHRANLLNPAYNVVGLGVIRSGDRLYIVQDFGHALPNYSTTEVKERIAATVAQARRRVNQPKLVRRDLPTADDTACSMAQADKLGTASVRQLAQQYTLLTYTSLDPRTLPANARHMLFGRNLRSFSVGACYARTESYPTGMYWVVLSLD
ncbi:MAG: CAP domain-containing protein [Candidatus Sulfotelmatobacter sp.]